MKSGNLEHITTSWEEGGRTYQGYVAIVNVPGDDTYEVGLSSLRKLLGVRRLTPQQTRVLNEHKPETVSFTGKYVTSPGWAQNDLVLTDESAREWALLVAEHLGVTVTL